MVEQEGEGKYEFIARIGGRGETDGVSEDTVGGRKQGERKGTEGLSGDYG